MLELSLSLFFGIIPDPSFHSSASISDGEWGLFLAFLAWSIIFKYMLSGRDMF
jgi:hypothetical protein